MLRNAHGDQGRTNGPAAHPDAAGQSPEPDRERILLDVGQM
ncbi:MAG TPA: hypothetical protein VLT79_01330 [Gemmatimonadales bacterium]|nr:hypothetical protein [Gemmatimonadales bacterium]